MTDRVALITGGARGIGRATAIALAKPDWTIAIIHRANETSAARTVDDIRARGKELPISETVWQLDAGDCTAVDISSDVGYATYAIGAPVSIDEFAQIVQRTE